MTARMKNGQRIAIAATVLVIATGPSAGAAPTTATAFPPPELLPEPAPPRPAAPTPPRATGAAGPLVGFTQELAGTTVSFELAPVAGGRVEFEVDGTTHAVEVAPFYVATTETTWDMYDIFVFNLDESADPGPDVDAVARPSRPYVSPDRGYGHAGYAAISLSFRGADHFCQWLAAKTGRRYRLPTEAEWRHLCAQSGITPETLDAHAWYEGNAEWTPHPVKQKKPDALGLYDLVGNVREWVRGVDGQPVALGGAFRDAEVGCAARAVPTPEWQVTDPQIPKSIWWLSDADFVGFRVVCVPDGQEGETP
ncbi:MAG: SUMF1/EgtB/PvdO family nonheme iron enzyme [Phycisphaerales bacterium]|nr:SUMF1/EgtB/PvdO family nonheme iron enzyme [Phycisphaerales bacterium]